MQRIILTTETTSQADLFVKLAHELHVEVHVLNDKEAIEKPGLSKLAEASFAKEWNSKEDAHWNDFLKNAEDVSAR
jgi:hypothetical protein